jgi:RNA polymerase sigma-70 factor (ECF subfamily)
MGTNLEQGTSLSLLDRLRDDATREVAWSEFLARYGRQLYFWGRRWGLQPSDAEDVAQETLLALARQIPGFRYEPGGSFRAWMKTIAYRCWLRMVEDGGRRAAIGGEAGPAVLASAAARDDLTQRCEAEFRRAVLEQAIERVRCRVTHETWEAFRLTALEDLPGTEVARRLSLHVGDVYNARWRVQRFLREAIHHLDPGP